MRELVEWELSSLSLGQAPSLNPVQIPPPPSTTFPPLSFTLLSPFLTSSSSCHCSRNVPRCCHDGVTSNILWLPIPKWTGFIERTARNRCRFIDYKSARRLRPSLFSRRLLKQRDVPDLLLAVNWSFNEHSNERQLFLSNSRYTRSKAIAGCFVKDDAIPLRISYIRCFLIYMILHKIIINA